MNLKGRDFLTLKDYTPEEIEYLIELAAKLKKMKKDGVVEQPLLGKNVALIFEKTSTRTRCSFEVAAHDLGMGVTYLDPKGSQIGKKESIADTARVLCTMFEGIEYRGFGQEIVEDLAKYSSVPVWNGLTNEYHPTQMLADMLTIKEKLGRLKGVKFVYMGDARYNMGNSLMIVCAKLGLHFTACTAKEYFPNEDLAKYSSVPVWNGLTNEYHPTQMLADMLTIKEKLGRLKGVKFVYMGDARYNMGNSLMIVCAKLGLHFTACTAKEYFPNEDLVNQCREWAKESGGSVTLTEDVTEGTKGAEVLYTDVWVSMGEPDEVWTERINALLPYQVNKKVMDNADKNAIFMHCLPAFHDLKTTIGKEIHDKFGLDEMEVTDEVFESEQSVVFDEAENRMHTIKAVMAATLGAY